VFLTGDWEKETWPLPDGPSRTIFIRAKDVKVRSTDDELSRSNLQTDPTRYFHNLSLDRGRSSRLGNVWKDPWDVKIGDEGAVFYTNALLKTFIWPDYTASKIMKHYGRAPYHEPTRKYLSTLLEKYEPLFAGRISQTATATMGRIGGLMSAQQDPFGLPRYYVPMQSLELEIKNFKERMQAAFKPGSGLLELWDNAFVQALAAGGIDIKAIAMRGKLRTRLRRS
jgi:hypothetical protein